MEKRIYNTEDKELKLRASKTPDQNINEIVGYAALFNTRSRPFYEKIAINGVERIEKITETIDKSAFDKADTTDTVYNIDHDDSKLLARKSAGNLELTVTEKGLLFRATPPQTSLTQDVVASINAGNYQENSFQFRIAKDANGKNHEVFTRYPDGMINRHILAIDIVKDVSTVVSAQYPNDNLATRSTVNVIIEGEPVVEESNTVNEIEKDSIDFQFIALKGKQF